MEGRGLIVDEGAGCSHLKAWEKLEELDDSESFWTVRAHFG